MKGEDIARHFVVLEGQGVDGRMGSEWILGRLAGGARIGSSWLWIGTGGGLLWIRWRIFGFWSHGVSCLAFCNFVAIQNVKKNSNVKRYRLYMSSIRLYVHTNIYPTQCVSATHERHAMHIPNTVWTPLMLVYITNQHISIILTFAASVCLSHQCKLQNTVSVFVKYEYTHTSRHLTVYKLSVQLSIYSFSNAVSTLDYAAPNPEMIHRWCIVRNAEGRDRGLF
jgi:hypothetical protein